MLKHKIFDDEFNASGNRTHSASKKRLAQEVGIKFAKDFFATMLDINNQGFFFEWEKFDVQNLAASHLFMYFKNTPKNIDELKNICKEAATIEWKNQCESTQCLPLKEYSFDEKINNFNHHFTINFIRKLKHDFYHHELSVKNDDWESKFNESYTNDYICKLAISAMTLKVKTKFNEKEWIDVIELMTNYIEDFFDKENKDFTS